MAEIKGNPRERLAFLQAELKAPKNQFNKFGGYKYRSCEDILEAVKPLCKKYGLLLSVSDEVQAIGERVYVVACATVTDAKGDDIAFIERATGWAREAIVKKGMDEAQITGAASSYARKYALNGLFLIDDTKDPDTYEGEAAKQSQKVSKQSAQTKKQEAPKQQEPAKETDPVYNLKLTLKHTIERWAELNNRDAKKAMDSLERNPERPFEYYTQKIAEFEDLCKAKGSGHDK